MRLRSRQRHHGEVKYEEGSFEDPENIRGISDHPYCPQMTDVAPNRWGNRWTAQREPSPFRAGRRSVSL